MIALVNPAAASSPAETITYDPSGTPSASGSANGWPFLYHGMEHESVDPNQFYYSGNGAYYSAQVMRSMSMTSAQGTSGPPGGGGPGPGPASLPAVSYSSANAFDPGQRLQDAGKGLGVGANAALPFLFTGPEGAPLAVPVFLAAAFSFDTASFLDELFGGGSPDYPPNYWVQLFRATRKHGGPHPVYTVYDAIAAGIVVGMGGFHPVSAGGAPSNQAPNTITVGDFGDFSRGGYSYCGPGNNGGDVINPTDECCEQHDLCYGAAGMSGWDVLKHVFGGGASSSQEACDRSLCNCIRSLGPSDGLADLQERRLIEELFCY